MFSPETRLIILLIADITSWSFTLYIFSAVFLVLGKTFGKLRTATGKQKRAPMHRCANFVWWLTKWPALVDLILEPFFHIALSEKMDVWFWVFEVMGFYNWWVYRDAGDDDDYKKLKKKLKENVKVLKGKLVVVPEPA
jgi:heme/copper-type cytochrome/quinol oxidase subunit 2